MQVRFKGSFAGLSLNKVISGSSHEEVLHGLRATLYGMIPRIPLTKKDDKLREQLRCGSESSWSDQKFIYEAIAAYNKERKREVGFTPIQAPADARGFIELACKLGLAQILVH
jgi:hypothetical protein